MDDRRKIDWLINETRRNGGLAPVDLEKFFKLFMNNFWETLFLLSLWAKVDEGYPEAKPKVCFESILPIKADFSTSSQ